MEWYTELAASNPDVVKFVPSIGKSVEGRDQPAVHITDGWQAKDKVYFQCQIHASKMINVLSTYLLKTIIIIVITPQSSNFSQESGFQVLCVCMLSTIS